MTPPDQLSERQVQEYLLYVRDELGCAKGTFSATWAGIKFFYYRTMPGHPYEQGFDLRLVPEKLTEPFLWPKPQMVFVNSMSDRFRLGHDFGHKNDVFVGNVLVNCHVFQVLTKRAERLRDLRQSKLTFAADLDHIYWA